MKSLVFFNNKGGVGKTTLACNFSSFIAQTHGVRVLLVDADPQCNATQAMLDDYVCEQLYEPTAVSPFATLYDCLRPLEIGEPTIRTDVLIVPPNENRFGISILPGHPSLSVIEDRLSDSWHKVLSRDIGGFRVTNWSSQLLRRYAGEFDLIVFDVGPSLGALNRSVILGCDYIVTPFGCDIYSLLGIKNISSWIRGWSAHYTSAVKEVLPSNADVFRDYPIVSDVSANFRFVGYSVQQYITKTFKTGRRPVRSYDQIMQAIPQTVEEAMDWLTPSGLDGAQLALGHVPNLFSLVPMAQSAKAPIHRLTSADGLVGSQYSQVQAYQELVAVLCAKLMSNMGLNSD